MSMKSDKGDSKPSHISIPQKDAIAILPPKRVRPFVLMLKPPQPTTGSVCATSPILKFPVPSLARLKLTYRVLCNLAGHQGIVRLFRSRSELPQFYSG